MSTDRPETGRREITLGLISMPWLSHLRPSAALGALTAHAQDIEGVEIYLSSVHLKCAHALGFDLYELIAEKAPHIGEMLFAADLHPEREEPVRAAFLDWAHGRGGDPATLVADATDWDAVFEHLRASVQDTLEQTARDAADGFDLIGLTTTMAQLFPSLAVARRIKQLSPTTSIVLGGPAVSGGSAAPLLQEYGFIDHIVQGEGELPLVALLEALARSEEPVGLPGVLSRGDPPARDPGHHEVPDLDTLAVPELGEYAELAEEHGVAWQVPVEGSRGCWWNRTHRTGDPRHACHFCNLNVQWRGYREKSADRLAAELAELAERHANTSFTFLDNVLREVGVMELAASLKQLPLDLDMFVELRASIRPPAIVALWEAGLHRVQIGVESLSSSLLRRMGKGTRTIQNLRALRTCTELGIACAANLIVGFPGSTAAEVIETVENIEHALAYQPCEATRFVLARQAAVACLPAAHGISALRNSERLRPGLPDEVWSRLKLHELDFDRDAEVDWSPVERAVERWKTAHREDSFGLTYAEGPGFVRVGDDRQDHRVIILQDLARELFLRCREIRGLEGLRRQLAPAGASPAEVAETLDQLVAERILFCEDEHYLSLPLAISPAAAARQLRGLAEPEP